MAVDATPIGSFVWQTSHLLSVIVICVSHTWVEFHKFVYPQGSLRQPNVLTLDNRYLAVLDLILEHLDVIYDLWRRLPYVVTEVDE